jgi:hypothetical protein
MKKAFFIVIMFFSVVAHSAEVSLTWANPKQNVDGTTIPPNPSDGALDSTRIEYGTCSGSSFGNRIGQVTASYPQTRAVIKNLRAGRTYCFRAYSVNNLSEESDASNVVSRKTLTVVPNSPTKLSNDVRSVVNILWKIQKTNRGYDLTYAGVLAYGTKCRSRSYKVNGVVYNVIRRNSNGEFVSICY